MHQGDPPRAVGVRVGVDVTRFPVGGPSGMPDPGVPGEIGRPRLPVRDPAHLLVDLDRAPDRCDAKRVVAPVLKPLQPLDQDPCCVPSSDVADNPAHLHHPGAVLDEADHCLSPFNGNIVTGNTVLKCCEGCRADPIAEDCAEFLLLDPLSDLNEAC